MTPAMRLSLVCMIAALASVVAVPRYSHAASRAARPPVRPHEEAEQPEAPPPAASPQSAPAAPGSAPIPFEAAPDQPPTQTEPAQPPRGEVYVNDRFGYAVRRPRDWAFRFEPGLDIIMAPADERSEIQVVARSFFDIRFQRVPEGPVTLGLREAARAGGDPSRLLRRSLPPALREYLQLFWLDSYVAWHTDATAEEYEQFKLESRRELSLAGHPGVELVYTLLGRKRPGIQKIKTIVVAFDERLCQLSYVTSTARFEDDLKAFHAVVNSLYMHRDRG
jgi:hypothetical protein